MPRESIMPNEPVSAARCQRTEPAVTNLPSLTDLTLQTGGVIGRMSGSPALRAAIRATLSSSLPNDC